MRTVLAVAAVISLVTGGAAVASPVADPPRGGSGYASIAWGGCAEANLAALGAECAMLPVPLDHAKPDGAKIRLAVSRIKHRGTAGYQGVMLVNPGGPGGAGLTLSALGRYVPHGAGDSYDWIGFDPRGVGASEPALTCDERYGGGYDRPPYVPATARLEKYWLARTAAYARACDAAGGPLLDHLRTTDTVGDMESIRTALGAERISFYGFSYGTYLGQVYATLHPRRVRRMVLDGVVDPRRVWYDANLDQDLAFDRNIGIYFDWLARHDSVYHLGRSGRAVAKRYDATRAALTAEPAGGVIGPDELDDVFLQAGYYVFGWAAVASAFAGWVDDGDATRLRALYDMGNPRQDGADNAYAVYLGVQCTDAPWPTSWATWKKDNWRVHARAPFETWANAWYNAPCRTWGAKAGTPVAVTGRQAPPVLLISETLDAATPYPGSLEVRRRFPRSVLVEGVGGTTHAGSLFGNPCVDDTVAAYLATGALPRRVPGTVSDRRCRPLAPPEPAALRHRAAGGRAALQELIGPR